MTTQTTDKVSDSVITERGVTLMGRKDVACGLKRLHLLAPTETALVSKEAVLDMVERKLARGVTNAERVIRFVASTERVDRMGDIVRQEWDLESFKSNPVILWNHDQAKNIGRSIREEVVSDEADEIFKKHGRYLAIYVEFMPKSHDEFADRVFRMYRDKFLKGGSVGYVPLSIDEVYDEERRKTLGLGPVGVEFLKNELAEFTLCTVPANQDALATEMKTAPTDEQRADFEACGIEVEAKSIPVAGDPGTAGSPVMFALRIKGSPAIAPKPPTITAPAAATAPTRPIVTSAPGSAPRAPRTETRPVAAPTRTKTLDLEERSAELDADIVAAIEAEIQTAGGQDTDEGAAISDALAALESAFEQGDAGAAEDAAQSLRTAFEATDNSMSSTLDDVDTAIDALRGSSLEETSDDAVERRELAPTPEDAPPSAADVDPSVVECLGDLEALIGSAMQSDDVTQIQSMMADAQQCIEDLELLLGVQETSDEEAAEAGDHAPAGGGGAPKDEGSARPPLNTMGKPKLEKKAGTGIEVVDELIAAIDEASTGDDGISDLADAIESAASSSPTDLIQALEDAADKFREFDMPELATQTQDCLDEVRDISEVEAASAGEAVRGKASQTLDLYAEILRPLEEAARNYDVEDRALTRKFGSNEVAPRNRRTSKSVETRRRVGDRRDHRSVDRPDTRGVRRGQARRTRGS